MKKSYWDVKKTVVFIHSFSKILCVNPLVKFASET